MARKRSVSSEQLTARVEALARNLFWTWHHPTQRLFARLDPVAWDATNHHPVKTLGCVTPQRIAQLLDDPGFVNELAACEKALRDYLRGKTWYARRKRKRMRVAYFSMEFALHECLPIYSGGLGVLAGDHLKSASDLGAPLCAVGLMYRRGYYTQRIGRDGATIVEYPQHDFDAAPVHDTGEAVDVPMGRRTVRAKVWRVDVGRVPLYLLDTDLKQNRKADRALTSHLYGGDNETRIQQEVLLGIGGTLALDAVGEKPTVYHLNEGHAAFCALERLRRLRLSGRSMNKSVEKVRRSTVFTTHTPVPAGHDRFTPAQVSRYLGDLAADAGLSRKQLLAFGRVDANDNKEPFCMTVLALKLAAHCNGVSKLHGEVSRQMWQEVYDAKRPSNVPIGHVTNGIHSRTWLAPEAEAVYRKHLRPRWDGAGPDFNPWRNVGRIPAAELWAMRCNLRSKLVNFIRQRLAIEIDRRGEPLSELVAAHEVFSGEALTIGFARRFATYKRAPLIFKDVERLKRIVGDPEMPVQLVFAGKAHPADAAGQAFVKKVYGMARRAGLRGRVVLIENYDMHVGRMLTSGCDVWLNNPIRPHEASGTSGMKPPLHGGLNCSILDGWWPECYNGRNGWEIGGGVEHRAQAKQDAHDAESIYELLEDEIVPTFYERDGKGIPQAWVRMMRASMKTVCAQFSTQRMVGDYISNYYLPANGA